MDVPWAVTREKVDAALQKIIEVGHPRKLILFGSYVSGTTHRNSDLDILVVTGDDVENPRKESVRLRRALKGILMPMDIVVIQESLLKELADTPGLIYREALKRGKLVYESAS